MMFSVYIECLFRSDIQIELFLLAPVLLSSFTDTNLFILLFLNILSNLFTQRTHVSIIIHYYTKRISIDMKRKWISMIVSNE